MARQASPAAAAGLPAYDSEMLHCTFLKGEAQDVDLAQGAASNVRSPRFFAGLALSKSLADRQNEAARVLASEPAQGKSVSKSRCTASFREPGTIDYTVQITCDANSGAGSRIGGSKV